MGLCLSSYLFLPQRLDATDTNTYIVQLAAAATAAVIASVVLAIMRVFQHYAAQRTAP